MNRLATEQSPTFSPLYRQQETAPVVVSTALCGLIIAQLAATSVLHQLA